MGDEAVQVGVAGFVHHAHAALAELAGDLVMEEALAGHQGYPELQIFFTFWLSLLRLLSCGNHERGYVNRARKVSEIGPGLVCIGRGGPPYSTIGNSC
jgi:hypothetical protein